MSAHSIDIVTPKCADCGNRATKRVRNTFNAEIGAFCATHARLKVEGLQRSERKNADDD